MKNKTETTIKFNNRNYKIRMLNVRDAGLVNVGSAALNRLLVSGEGSYVSDEAKYTDDQIYYFISPASFKLSDKKLAYKILEEMN